MAEPAGDINRRSAPARFRTTLSPCSCHFCFINVLPSPLVAPGKKRLETPAVPVRKLSFGATSDLGQSNLPWPSLYSAAQDQFDLFLIAGNSLYWESFPSPFEQRLAWAKGLAQPSLANLTHSTTLFNVMGDGDILNNFDLVRCRSSQFLTSC